MNSVLENKLLILHSIMDAHKKTLGELIFREEFKKYSVPLYQRPYSWKPDHIDNFWEDLTDGKINFIGPIVIHEEVVKKTTEKGKKIKITERTVVDGQQRLITSTIFASILRDIFKALDRQYTGENFQKIAFNIQLRYIIAEHIDGRTKDYKLQTADETSS